MNPLDTPRPLRHEHAYDHPAPATDISRDEEDRTMDLILRTFTDEEIRIIRDCLDHSTTSPAHIWLWSMFDSISTPEQQAV